MRGVRRLSCCSIVSMSIFVCVQSSQAQLDRVLDGLKGLTLEKAPVVSDAKVAAGLKEALQIGTENAVNLTGVLDGYFRNPSIKILIPEKLKMVDQALRLAGYGAEMNELEEKMNRAAERAAPLAKPILIESIRTLTLEDAKRILSGGETAATEYFREKTGGSLKKAFAPEVEKVMSDVGLVQMYKTLIQRYEAIPFAKPPSFNIDEYVVDKSLAGLFLVLGEQERQIRSDPKARVTDLLKEVFAQPGQK